MFTSRVVKVELQSSGYIVIIREYRDGLWDYYRQHTVYNPTKSSLIRFLRYTLCSQNENLIEVTY